MPKPSMGASIPGFSGDSQKSSSGGMPMPSATSGGSSGPEPKLNTPPIQDIVQTLTKSTNPTATTSADPPSSPYNTTPQQQSVPTADPNAGGYTSPATPFNIGATQNGAASTWMQGLMDLSSAIPGMATTTTSNNGTPRYAGQIFR